VKAIRVTALCELDNSRDQCYLTNTLSNGLRSAAPTHTLCTQWRRANELHLLTMAPQKRADFGNGDDSFQLVAALTQVLLYINIPVATYRHTKSASEIFLVLRSVVVRTFYIRSRTMLHVSSFSLAAMAT
jgi:hypothetical protein